jgi:hypothetical protein
MKHSNLLEINSNDWDKLVVDHLFINCGIKFKIKEKQDFYDD